MSDRMKYLVRVGYRSSDLADRTDIPERFFTGPSPKYNHSRFCIETSNISPLCSSIVSSEYKGLEGLLEIIQNDSQELGLGKGFYDNLEGEYIREEEIPEALKGTLSEKDNFGDGKGRYLVVVTSGGKEEAKFNYGHFRGLDEDNSILITDKHKLGAHTDERLPMFPWEYPLSFSFGQTKAIYGKGMIPLYEAMK